MKITPTTLVKVDDEKPITWAEFLAANAEACEEDIATIKSELEAGGFCRWDYEYLISVVEPGADWDSI